MGQVEDGAPAPFIAVQPFPALLDLPLGSDAVKVSCGSRHTAVVTREWGWEAGLGWSRKALHATRAAVERGVVDGKTSVMRLLWLIQSSYLAQWISPNPRVVSQ